MRNLCIILAIFLTSCSEKATTIYSEDLTNKNKIMDSLADIPEIDRDSSWAFFHSKYKFSNLPSKVYAGKLVKPDFKSVQYGNEEGFKEFLLEHIKGLPINFAGKYTIVEKSCGTMCLAIYIIDRTTGQIFAFPPDGEGKWGYRYQADSYLLIGNSYVLNDSMNMYLKKWEIEPEFYSWADRKFGQLR